MTTRRTIAGATIDNVTIYYREDTGEFAGLYEPKDGKVLPKPVNPPEGKRYVGMEVRYPSECVTEDQFKESLAALDGWYYLNTEIHYGHLFEMLADGRVTQQQARLLEFVAQNIVGWNYTVTTVKKMRECVGVDSSNFSKLLKSLSPHYLRVCHYNKPDRGNVVLQINPSIAWAGLRSNRGIATEKWCTHRNTSGLLTGISP